LNAASYLPAETVRVSLETVGFGSILPIRRDAGERVLFARSGRLESTYSGHCGSRLWRLGLGLPPLCSAPPSDCGNIRIIPARERGANMTYYISRVLPVPFDEVVTRTREALKAEGFGVLTEIDVRDTLKAKIGVEFPSYIILGACNPALAHEALRLENKVGTMLPCNVVLRDAGNDQTDVAAIDPVASMQAIDNPALKEAAQIVRSKLEKAVAVI